MEQNKKTNYNDKIYFTKDIVDKLVEMGHDRSLALNFLTFMTNEVLEGVRNPNIVDIQIINFGTFFLPLSEALRNVLKYEKLTEQVYNDRRDKIYNESLDFHVKKYKTLIKHTIGLRKKAKKTKFHIRKVKVKNILNG